MINSIRLKNIKGFVDTGEIEIRPITLVIGQNSSGKSSVMRFPLVLKQTILDDSMAPLLFYGKSIDYGSYEDVVFSHKPNNKISFSVELDVFGDDVIGGYYYYFRDRFFEQFGEFNDLRMTVHVIKGDASIVVEKFSLETDKSNIFDLTLEGSDYHIVYKTNKGKGKRKITVSAGDIVFDKFIPDFRFTIMSNNRGMNKSLDDLSRVMDLFNFYANHWSRIASSIHYIGPFRKTPERAYRHKDNAFWHVGSDGEYSPNVLAQDYRAKGTLVSEVSKWLEKHLEFRLKINNLGGEMFRIMIEDLQTGATNNLIDVGHGLSQLIPIVIQTFLPKYSRNPGKRTQFSNNDLIVVEQPELHLHPAAQASLADLFIEGVTTDGVNPSQRRFLIETHSEHMILRFRRYIIQGRIRPEDIAIYFTSKDKNTGSTEITRLDVHEDGSIPNWPDGFFAEDFNELVLLRQALKEKYNQGEDQW